MNEKKIKHFQELLLKDKADVLDTIDRMNDNEPNESMAEYFDELSLYDNHPADLGTEMFMMEQNMNLKDVQKLRLREIEISLDKIKDGTFGICDTCGDSINEDRLEVMPEAKICIECANDKIPIDKLMDYRPKEEDNLSYPFGRTFNDVTEEDVTAFDGEDSYQAVARFNEVPNDPSYSTGDYQGVFDERELGIVQDVEQYSEDYYVGQIEDVNRRDIPDEEVEE